MARAQSYWIAGLFGTIIWGFASTRFRTIRSPLFVGYVIFTAGIVGMATIQPGDSTNLIAFAGLAGLGFGSPLILIITGVQLSTPHSLIATATAVTTSSRAVAATVFTAIYAATLTTGLDEKLPAYIARAAAQAGLPVESIPAFVGALATNDAEALGQIPGVSPSIIDSGVRALQQAFADSLRNIYIIAAAFGVVACVACLFLGDMRKTMNYHVDAPVEDLHAKHHQQQSTTQTQSV